MQGSNPTWSLWFTRLAFITALLTWGLIVFGAIVRVTESGLGCGEHWPLCNGTIFPPLDNITAWIEWLHRLFALLIGVLGLAMLYTGWRSGQRRLIFGTVVLAAVLYVIQSSLGAIVVVLSLPRTTVALHLGNAMLLLAAFVVVVVALRHKPGAERNRDPVTMLVYLTTALSYVIIVSGALVRAREATLACIDWPLCNGDLIPLVQGEAQMVHMLHRYAVLALGVALVLLLWQVLQHRSSPLLRRTAVLALGVYIFQALVGAGFVMSAAQPAMGATHVGLAAATWGLLVVMSAAEYLATRPAVQFQSE